MQLVAVAFVGFSSSQAAPCSSDGVEVISADRDRFVVRSCCDAVNRHFVVYAQLSDIASEYHRHICTAQASACSACLQVQA